MATRNDLSKQRKSVMKRHPALLLVIPGAIIVAAMCVSVSALWKISEVGIFRLQDDAPMAINQSIFARGNPPIAAHISERCQEEFSSWDRMQDNAEKQAKLRTYEQAYGTLNFHSNCVGNPRQIQTKNASPIP